LLANAALLLGSYWIVQRGLAQRGGLAVWLGAAIVFWTCCTLGVEIAGALGLISLDAIVVEAALIFLIAAMIRRHTPAHGFKECDEGRTERASGDALAGLALLLSVSLILGMRSLLLAVKVVSDGPIYHLYFAARWWKAGQLILVAAPFGENAATYFPANADLWFTWLMASWGSDRLAKVGQAPFWALASLAAFGCARELGARKSASLVASCWFASSTPFLIYSFEPNVDTIFVAGYMLAVYFLLRHARRQGGTVALCLSALAAGLAMGSKPVGVVFVPPLVALALAVVLTQPAGARDKLLRVLLVGSLPLVTAGYWFVRNMALTGNPIYPLEVRILGKPILNGWYGPDAMRFSQYYVPVRDWRALCDTLLAVLDPRLAPIWIAALATGWMTRSREVDTTRRWTAIFSLLAILNIALYWLCIPYRSQQRFMIQALGLAVVPLALTLDRRPWLRFIAVALLGLHLLTAQGFPFAAREGSIPWDFTPHVPNAVDAPIPLLSRLRQTTSDHATLGSTLSVAALGALGLASALLVWTWSRLHRRSDRFPRGFPIAVLASALFLLSGFLDLLSVGIDPRFLFYPPFADFYRGWRHLDFEAGPSGARVAYAGTNIPYYLLGERLRNDVRYINVDAHRNWLLHDYHHEASERGNGRWPNSRPGWDRLEPDFAAWLENLDAERIELLVATRVNPEEGRHNVADSEGFPIERVWADSHPERFDVLYGAKERDPWFRLYRLRRPTSAVPSQSLPRAPKSVFRTKVQFHRFLEFGASAIAPSHGLSLRKAHI
jgi:hypothetical protein